LIFLRKENVRLNKEKEELERYYLFSNEQFFLRFDIQNNLLQNFSSLNAITKNDLKAKNLQILEQNNLLVDKNKNKRRFQSVFLQMQEGQNYSHSSTVSESLTETETMSIKNRSKVEDESNIKNGKAQKKVEFIIALIIRILISKF
jgi:hypothetical protein